MLDDEFLPVAVRGWTGERNKWHKRERASWMSPPSTLLVLDTETTIDEAQALTFGSAQLWALHWSGIEETSWSGVRLQSSEKLEEIIFYANDLEDTDPNGYRVLVEYCREHDLKLVSQDQFMEDWVYRYCVPRLHFGRTIVGRGTVVGFNLPFDMSRLAYRYGAARGHGKNREKTKNSKEFSFQVFPDHVSEETGEKSENRFRPRLKVTSLDSKKAFMQWGSSVGERFLVEFLKTPESAGQSNPFDEPSFLDMRQLIWGMTNRSVSLQSGCELFGLPDEFKKGHAEEHGRITPEYINYNRQDVTATSQLAITVLPLYMKHPIELHPGKVYSPASIAKGYLRQMGITPVLDRPNGQVPKDGKLMGWLTSAFYGGRAEAHIKSVVPVTVNDFTSMYCTVNTLLKLWDHLTVSKIKVDDVTDEFRSFLDNLTLETILNPSVWPTLTGFVQIIPDPESSILPVRAEYDNLSGYNVGINRFHSLTPFWYAMPDVIASVLLTGKVPQILRAVRFVPESAKMIGLKPVKFMGSVEIDPRTVDFFREVTEQRAATKKNREGEHTDNCLCEVCRIIEAYKVTGNAGSYGIFVEILREELVKEKITEVFGLYDDPWECTVSSRETAQEFCYPPIGCVITAGARLMLAILEKLVTDAGGTWLFCDTDSMAIVCDREGSLVPCNGGPYRMPDGREAVQALTRERMTDIRVMINRLNPFDRDAIPEILKDETAKTNLTGQVYGYSISAKRYTLFTYDDNGRPVVPEKIDGKEAFKRHGLGLYLNPVDPRAEERDQQWIRQTWQWILDKNHGLNPAPLPWMDYPALVRVHIPSPHVMRVLRDWNEGKPYSRQVKPFNFVLMVSEYTPVFSSESGRRFIAPYTTNPDEWLSLPWYDLHNMDAGPVYVTTSPDDDPGRVRVKGMDRVIAEFITHPESKSKLISGRDGLMERRIVRTQSVVHIGKETNRLEEVQSHLVTSWDGVYTKYSRADVSVILRAFEGCSLREIARLVNAESEELRRDSEFRYQEKHGEPSEPYLDNWRKAYGDPVTIDHKVVARFFNGAKIEPENARAIIRTAAKRVRPAVAEKRRQRIIMVSDIGYGPYKISPEKALAIWRMSGKTRRWSIV